MADVVVRSGALIELEDERRSLLRSIEDLDAEWAAGDIAEADYRKLRDHYTLRAAAVLRALDQTTGHEVIGEPTTDQRGPGTVAEAVPRPSGRSGRSRRSVRAGRLPRRRRRQGLLWGAVGVFAVAAVVVVAADVTARLPGQTATGSLDLSSPQKLARTLAQAATLESEGKASQALALYHEVLAQDPSQEQALAETGWLEFEAGVLSTKGSLLSAGQSEEHKAEGVDPGAYAPHLYLGSMLLVERQPSQAAGEYAQFLADDPPVSEEQTAWPYVVRAFTEAGKPVPPVPAGVRG